MKTNRGSFYYIRIGSLYYAGTQPVMASVVVREPREWTEDEKARPRYKRGGQRRSANPKWKVGKGVYWTYTNISGNAKPMTDVVKKVATAQYTDQWVEDFSKAKKFRLESKARAKIEEFKSNIPIEGTRPQLEFYQGEAK